MTLFDPFTLRGGIELANRIAMAPMTRARAAASDLPSPFAAEYYAQRASAGLVITEGTIISPVAKGYSLTPGIFNEEQAEAWSRVAEAVHGASPGSRIFTQLWHVGRISHPDISGHQPVAPSPQKAPNGKVWLERADGWKGNIDCGEPRALSAGDIAATVNDYRAAARFAAKAGFDGIEIHAANGYLIDQFLRATTNRRTDEYGGPTVNRLRFMREVVEAVCDELGAGRVGIRFSPIVQFGDTADPAIEDTILQAARWLDQQELAYLHVVESENQDLFADTERGQAGESVADQFRVRLRERFAGPIVLAYRYDLDRAEAVLESGLADLIAMGRPFIANPDLVERLRDGVELAESDTSTWYGGGAAGYTDYARHNRRVSA
jgi:N-ethylmaleimide reductase